MNWADMYILGLVAFAWIMAIGLYGSLLFMIIRHAGRRHQGAGRSPVSTETPE